MSFFVNAGMRFVTELAKMRAFAELWDEIAKERAKTDAKAGKEIRDIRKDAAADQRNAEYAAARQRCAFPVLPQRAATAPSLGRAAS